MILGTHRDLFKDGSGKSEGFRAKVRGQSDAKLIFLQATARTLLSRWEKQQTRTMGASRRMASLLERKGSRFQTSKESVDSREGSAMKRTSDLGQAGHRQVRAHVDHLRASDAPCWPTRGEDEDSSEYPGGL